MAIVISTISRDLGTTIDFLRKRKDFDLPGVPLRGYMRQGKNPFADKK